MKIKGLFLFIIRKAKIVLIRLQNKNIILGSKVTIDYKTKIFSLNNKLTLGKGVYLRSIKRGYQAAMPFSTTILMDVPGAEIYVGDNTRINGAYIHAQKNIKIGENCVIASGVQILDTNGHVLNSLDRTKGRDEPKDVLIGSNVWIGLNAIILKGSIIGDNSVISAGSIVKGEFPSNSLIVGNPATVVKKLSF